MELFIAIFGVLYYMRKYLCDKRERKILNSEYNREMSNDEHAKNNWLLSVTNEPLEDELCNRVFQCRIDDVEKLLPTGVYCPHTKTTYDRKWVLRILMASRGFMTREDAEHGILVYFGKTEGTIEWQYKNLTETILYLDRKLRERCISHDMFLESVNKYYPFPLRNTPAPGSAVSVGRIVWRPMVSSWKMRQSEEILARAGMYF